MQEGDYTFQLTVTDSSGQQDTAQVTVIVQPGIFLYTEHSDSHLFLKLLFVLEHSVCEIPPENNKPPVADSGPDKELTLPVDRTTLDGSKSSDDQKISTYHWTKTKSVTHVHSPCMSFSCVYLRVGLGIDSDV